MRSAVIPEEHQHPASVSRLSNAKASLPKGARRLNTKIRLATILAALGLLALFAASASAKVNSAAVTGGTIQVDLQSDLDYSDPALDYYQPGWEMEYATCLKLVNYQDGNGPKTSQLVPEAATGFPKVSNDGKTYDFTVNAGFTKFSNGQPVTA